MIKRMTTTSNFNPRAPRGARPSGIVKKARSIIFQSTRPAWGATARYCCACFHHLISIHAPRVGRDCLDSIRLRDVLYFNPRAPRGARLKMRQMRRLSWNFNPRAPRGARPSRKAKSLPSPRISIHAPRVGRDAISFTSSSYSSDFNPRAPRGARPLFPTSPVSSLIFQSTRPAWGATMKKMEMEKYAIISIHAPRVGRDFAASCECRGRHISIHAPRVGRDVSSWTIASPSS